MTVTEVFCSVAEELLTRFASVATMWLSSSNKLKCGMCSAKVSGRVWECSRIENVCPSNGFFQEIESNLIDKDELRFIRF